MLFENDELLPIAGEIFNNSVKELIESLIGDQQSLKKLEEYVTLLNEKKNKKSLETEISEALTPILEKNTILYGTFLYETAPLQENTFSDTSVLFELREFIGSDAIVSVFNNEANIVVNEQSQNRNTGVRDKIVGGLSVAGLAGAGAGGYKYGKKQGISQGISQIKNSKTYQTGEDVEDIKKSVSKLGKNIAKGASNKVDRASDFIGNTADKVKNAGSRAWNYLKNVELPKRPSQDTVDNAKKAVKSTIKNYTT